MTQNALQWCALYLRSRHEKKVDSVLRAKGVETFLPLIERHHIWSDRKKMVEEPLLPSYLFVRTELRCTYHILETPGVVRLVSNNHKPSAIPESQIESLRRIIRQPMDVQREKYIDVGEHVKVTAGPLMGVEGIVIRMQNMSRLIVSIGIIEQSVSVIVPTDLLEVIPVPTI